VAVSPATLRAQAELFRRERQILASLSHANIAHLLDAGVTENNISFLVMEYVEGTTIDVHCCKAALSVAQRLKLMQQVCLAVANALLATRSRDSTEFSPGIDFTSSDCGQDGTVTNRNGIARPVDFSFVPNQVGSFDLGAYEAGLTPFWFKFMRQNKRPNELRLAKSWLNAHLGTTL
jgi:hypothetical protein